MIIWLTGQPGSGKTTLANQLIDKIYLERNVSCDELRLLLYESLKI